MTNHCQGNHGLEYHTATTNQLPVHVLLKGCEVRDSARNLPFRSLTAFQGAPAEASEEAAPCLHLVVEIQEALREVGTQGFETDAPCRRATGVKGGDELGRGILRHTLILMIYTDPLQREVFLN